MRDFLNSYIDTLPDRSKIKAGALMQRALLDKQEIAGLLQKVTENLSLGSFVFSEIKESSKITGTDLLLNLQELSLRLDLFYTLSNDVSSLLDSETQTISSEIRSLEKELDYIQKSISNYAFRLSDAGAFNFGFLDSFSDTINKANDIDFIVPDRANMSFSEDEQAFIDTSEDVLKLGDTSSVGIPFSANLVDNNFQGLINSMSDVQNIAIPNRGTGWRASINSPIPMTGTVSDFIGIHGISSYNGAQAIIELFTEAPAPCDFITLSPLTGSSIDIIQIVTYSDIEESDPVELLDSIYKLDNQSSFYFDARAIAKVKVFIRQPTYRRRAREAVESEKVHQRIFTQHRLNLGFDSIKVKGRVRNLTGISQVFVKNFLREKRGVSKLSVRVSNRRLDLNRWGPMHEQLNLGRITPGSRNTAKWFKREPFDVITEIIEDTKQLDSQLDRMHFARRNDTSRRVNPRFKYLRNSSTTDSVGSRTSNNAGRFVNTTGRLRRVKSIENKTASTYRYELGLNHIKIGIQARFDKGYFISKQLPSSGDVGQVMIRESQTNAVTLSDPTLDHNFISSVEYSVSNVARPFLETHWEPILPVNISEVVAERFFIDDLGKGFFRFPASNEGGIILYRNNKIFPLSGLDMIPSQTGSSTLGLILDPSLVSQSDIFTVDYSPKQVRNIIDFESSGFAEAPLSASFDQNGAGEGFDDVSGQLTISLKNEPYIDQSQVDSATYSTSTGLSYQPITIELDDGTNAINLTNYKGGTQQELDASTNANTFLHRGKTLIFNRQISQGFRVFYEYLPNNVRVRIVLRSNTKESTASPKVDFYQVKAKTRQANTRTL
jgi:hypothetical protein